METAGLTVDLDRLEALVRAPVASVELELVLIEEVSVHGRPTLRVYIDGPDGVKLDDCIRVNRMLMELPEIDEHVSDRFDLEVSSPGVERPLRSLAHFERFVGEVARVKLVAPVEGRKKLEGKIISASHGVVRMTVDDRPTEFAVDNVKRAHLVLDAEALMARLKAVPE